MRRRTGFTLIEVLLVVAIIALIVMGYMIWNLNRHMGRIEDRVRFINNEWANKASVYMKHDNEEHAIDYHKNAKVPGSHIPPPPPPEVW